MPDQEPQPLTLPDALTPDNPLWHYALTCWQSPAVVEACLELQAEGWSVTRILCAGWLAQNGQRFTGVEDAKVTEWRSRVTGSIRSARKSIPKQANGQQSLRDTLAKAELAAEKTELALAWQAFHQQPPEAGAMNNNHRQLTERNLLAAAPEPTHGPATRTLIAHLAEHLVTEASRPCS